MKNSGFIGKSKVCSFNKVLHQTENEVLFNPLLLIHAKRYLQAEKPTRSQAHFIFFVPQKIKRACLSPPLPKLYFFYTHNMRY